MCVLFCPLTVFLLQTARALWNGGFFTLTEQERSSMFFEDEYVLVHVHACVVWWWGLGAFVF